MNSIALITAGVSLLWLNSHCYVAMIEYVAVILWEFELCSRQLSTTSIVTGKQSGFIEKVARHRWELQLDICACIMMY